MKAKFVERELAAVEPLMLCECSQMDWTGHPLTTEHHPECKAGPASALKESLDSEVAVPLYYFTFLDARGNVLESAATDETSYMTKHTFIAESTGQATGDVTVSLQHSVDGEHWEELEIPHKITLIR